LAETSAITKGVLHFFLKNEKGLGVIFIKLVNDIVFFVELTALKE